MECTSCRRFLGVLLLSAATCVTPALGQDQGEEVDPGFKERNAMSLKPFQGISNIQELSCSGEALDPDATLSSMILYVAQDGENILASVNTVNKECSTSGVFASCVLAAEADTRKTTLRTLVMDLQQGETRRYGCEINSVKSGERAKTKSWFFEVTRRE